MLKNNNSLNIYTITTYQIIWIRTLRGVSEDWSRGTGLHAPLCTPPSLNIFSDIKKFDNIQSDATFITVYFCPKGQ